MRTSEQLKAHIRNRAKIANVQTEILLRSFMLERFLERIANSKNKHNFILKGGMLIASMVGIAERTTMDMDATIKGRTLNTSEITAMIEEILSIPMNDGVSLTIHGIEEIREEADYPGFRISIGALLDKTRQILKIDITTGDFITPKEIVYIIHTVADSPQMSGLWRRYQSKYSYARNVTWEMAAAAIVKLAKEVPGVHLMPPCAET